MLPSEVPRWDRMMLLIGAWRNRDPQAKKEELEGFDFVNRNSIEPILELFRQTASPE